MLDGSKWLSQERILAIPRADLRGADLRGVDLSGAFLENANLSCANITDSLKICPYLRDVDLRGALVTNEQLAQVSSLKGATMPDGSKHP